MDVFDGHCDTILCCYQHGGGIRENAGHLDLVRTRKFGRYAQFFALFGSPEDMPQTPLHQVFQEEYVLFLREMEENRDLISFCKSWQEAETAFAAGKSAAFLSVEGADLLNCDLARLDNAHRLGVRAVNLTWNHANALSGAHGEEPDRGLSAQGRAFVQRMQALGMLVDVSHLSDPGFWDVMEEAVKPIIATHSNARAVHFDTRNLTDGQFTAIMKNNGVAGLNLYAGFLGKDPSMETVVRHLEHWLALGGGRHISLGGDWDGITAMPRDMTGIQDLDGLYELLLRRNYREELVRGVFFKNLQRVVNEVCNM